jgi:hypothetical protein
MAHAQKPDLVFQGNGRVHLNRRGSQFSRVLAVEESGSAGSDCISWVDRVPRYSGRALPSHSIRLFPLHFPSRASPCAITFQTDSTCACVYNILQGVKSWDVLPEVMLMTISGDGMSWQRFIVYFTFMWACIVINFLIIKPTRYTNFSNLFWNENLNVSDSSSVHHQELFTVHSAMVYVIQVCR